MASNVQQPTPAVNQVWRYYGLLTDIDDGRAFFRSGENVCLNHLRETAECIGISTSAGRVMVGERRRGAGIIWAVDHVSGHDEVSLVPEEDVHGYVTRDGRTYPFTADVVASNMALLPPTPQGAEASERKPVETDAELRARYYAAAHEEHPRPGTKAWLRKRVAYECGITVSDVEVEEDPRRARVAVRVPRYVSAEVVKAAERRIAEDMPASIGFGMFYKEAYVTREDIERAPNLVDMMKGLPPLTQADVDRIASRLSIPMCPPLPANPRCSGCGGLPCRLILTGTSCGALALRAFGRALMMATTASIEQGPGIAARVPVRPSVRPDVVVCAEWDERWGWA